MDAQQTGQVSRSAADIYQEFFVPALFGPWAGQVCDAVQLTTGDNVLDVACGTGVVAIEALGRVGSGGAVTGLDINPDMLAVARSRLPDIEWRQASVGSMPFPEGTFDAVTCQFGLMFFDDRSAALTEVWRVLKPTGRLAVAVWDTLDNSPGYAAVVDLLERLFGPEIASGMRAPFTLGNTKCIAPIFAAAGITDIRITTCDGTARFPSIESWVHTDIKGWTLADLIDDNQYALLSNEALQVLKRFQLADGGVEFSSPAHIVTATKT